MPGFKPLLWDSSELEGWTAVIAGVPRSAGLHCGGFILWRVEWQGSAGHCSANSGSGTNLITDHTVIITPLYTVAAKYAQQGNPRGDRESRDSYFDAKIVSCIFYISILFGFLIIKWLSTPVWVSTIYKIDYMREMLLFITQVGIWNCYDFRLPSQPWQLIIRRFCSP